MAEPAYLRFPISSASISNRNFDNLQVQLGSAEQKIKITKGIKITKITSSSLDPYIVLSPENLGTAEGVPYPLFQQIAESAAEELIAEDSVFLEDELEERREKGDPLILRLTVEWKIW